MQRIVHHLQRSWQSHGLDDEWVAGCTSSLKPNSLPCCQPPWRQRVPQHELPAWTRRGDACTTASDPSYPWSFGGFGFMVWMGWGCSPTKANYHDQLMGHALQ